MEAGRFIRQQTFGSIQRLLHWWIGSLVTALLLLGVSEKALEVSHFKSSMRTVHVVLGFGLAIGFFMRLMLGMIGPRQSRLSELWRAAIGRSAAKRAVDDSKHQFGYERIAAMAYLFLYFITAVSAVSGLMLAGMRYDKGPLAGQMFDDFTWHQLMIFVHNVAFCGMAVFVFAHFAGMIQHKTKSGTPVAQSMISGYQYRKIQQDGEDQ